MTGRRRTLFAESRSTALSCDGWSVHKVVLSALNVTVATDGRNTTSVAVSAWWLAVAISCAVPASRARTPLTVTFATVVSLLTMVNVTPYITFPSVSRMVTPIAAIESVRAVSTFGVIVTLPIGGMTVTPAFLVERSA